MEDKRSSSKTNEEHSPSPPQPQPPPSGPSPSSGEPPAAPAQSLSPEETRYNEILSSDPNNLERRFPVDRRKLERLIVAGKDRKRSADDFFNDIMKNTGTVILWPSRLKIGAKSKKDPQVKVAGPPDGVSKAKDAILEELDTKNNRVTLKINIANSEHSHVIGKEGCNIRKVHTDTQCHIHFPDSNRYPQGEKSDQVSITGSLPSVESARIKVRDLQPVVVVVTLPLPGHMTLDPQSPDMMSISETYNVTISIKPHPPSLTMMVSVRSSMRFLDGLKLAVVKIVEYVTGDYPPVTEVTLYADIAVQHQRTVMGMDGGNLQDIMHETCTSIHFPDPHSRYRSSQITIIGGLENVFDARHKIMGCLPVAILFDVIDEGEQLTSGYLGELMQSLDIYISMKPKGKNHSQSFIIKSIERNIDCVYIARQTILDVACSSTSRPAQLPLHPQPGIQTMEQIEELSETSSLPDVNKGSPLLELPKPQTLEPEESNTEEQERETDPLKTSLNKSQGRLTAKSFVDYDQRKEKAEQGTNDIHDKLVVTNPQENTDNTKKSKIERDVPRFPTSKWSGDFFSTSMPPAPRGEANLGGLSAFPKGLDSLNKTSFQALMNQAAQEREYYLSKTTATGGVNKPANAFMNQAALEREQAILTREQSDYDDIKDLSSLLAKLGLEKYEVNFAEEEVDFETFLTMNEEDLKEVGVVKLGARRKLQIAISEIRKLRSEAPKPRSLPVKKMSVPGPLLGVSRPGSDRTGGVRLAPSYMSRSVRF